MATVSNKTIQNIVKFLYKYWDDTQFKFGTEKHIRYNLIIYQEKIGTIQDISDMLADIKKNSRVHNHLRNVLITMEIQNYE